MARWSAALLLGWWRQKRGGVQLRSKRQAASHGLAWTIHQKNSDCQQTAHPEKLTGAHDPQRALQKNGDIMCHPILVPPFLQEFDVANANVGAERNHKKTEVIYDVNDLDAAALVWRIRDVQNMTKVSTVTACSITLEVAVGPRQHIADPLVGKADVIRAMHERVQPDPADGICLPPRECGSQPHQPHPASTRPHNPPGTAACGNLR